MTLTVNLNRVLRFFIQGEKSRDEKGGRGGEEIGEREVISAE